MNATVEQHSSDNGLSSHYVVQQDASTLPLVTVKAREIRWDMDGGGLNPHEAKLLLALQSAPADCPLSIAELARLVFPGVRPASRANSWVRNALRRLRGLGVAIKVASGCYQVA